MSEFDRPPMIPTSRFQSVVMSKLHSFAKGVDTAVQILFWAMLIGSILANRLPAWLYDLLSGICRTLFSGFVL